MRSTKSLRLRRVAAAALAAAAGTTMLAPTGAAADVRVSPNFALLPDRNPIYGRDALGLAVNPNNRRHMVAVYADWHSLWCEVAMTRNGGATWRRSRLKAPEGFIQPPCTVGAHLSALIDQTIAFGRRGNVYTTFASSSGTEEAPRGQSVLVARSGNGGRTFRTGVVALPGGAVQAEGPDYVLPKLAVAPGRGRSGQDRVYLVAGDDHGQDTVFSRSDDSGRNWSERALVNPTDLRAIEQSQPVIGRGGDLYVAWRTQEPGTQPGTVRPQGHVVVSRSSDAGATWTSTRTASVEGYIYEGPPQPPFPRNPTTFTASTFPRLAADRRSGNVYLVYGNGRQPGSPQGATAADHFIHPDIDVYFQRSTDGGATWSQARRLNGQPEIFPDGVTQTRHPNVTVARNGRVDIVWNDRRHWYRGCLHTHTACAEARIQDIYYRHSTDGGRSFEAERRITDRSFNGDIGFDYRFGSYWDYGPVSVPLGRNGLIVGWMDSRDGNVETDNQGLWLARVDLRAGDRIPVQRVRARSADALAVRLSRLTYPAGAEAVLAATFATRPWSRAVIVHEDDYAGVLAGGVLGRAFIGPVLLASEDGLSEAAERELERLAPVGAFIVGGEGSLGSGVVEDVVETGVPADQVIRVDQSGDAAGTVARVAHAMDRRTQADKDAGKPAFDAVMLVNPETSDAAAAAALATHRRLPVLLSDEDEVPAATLDAIRTLNINRVLVVGGTDAISQGVLAQLPNAERLNGNTPAGTSRSVVLAARDRGVPDNIIYTERPRREIRAALLGAAAGRMGGQLLLSDGLRSTGRALRAMGIEDRVDRIVTAARAGGR